MTDANPTDGVPPLCVRAERVGKKCRPVTIGGKAHNSLKAASEHHGVSYHAVYWRVYRIGESPEAAIQHLKHHTKPKNPVAHNRQGNPTTVEDNTYPNLKAACAAYGVRYGSVLACMHYKSGGAAEAIVRLRDWRRALDAKKRAETGDQP